MSDLYKDLGVPKDADKATIKKVYRKKVMKAHPDKGGSKEEFQAIQKAYEVLGDDARRAHYDKTGQDGVEDRATILNQRIAALFCQLIENGDVDHVDIVASMIANINQGIAHNKGLIRDHEKRIAKYQRVLKRIKKKTAGTNILQWMVEGQISGNKLAIERGTDEIAKQTEMMEVIKDYEYKVDSDPMAARFGHNPTLLEMVRGMGA